jgi:hypothetical protein
VAICRDPPIIPLGYEPVDGPASLKPTWSTLGQEWRAYCPSCWGKLDGIGPVQIMRELAGISGEHDGRDLALCCYEDLLAGIQCHRVIFSAWLEDKTGIVVPEITDDGEAITLDRLHPQVMPVRPR